ncbi:hypothetical protein MK139_05575 [bacterium]|nr:hypothetical protein [bacterium]
MPAIQAFGFREAAADTVFDDGIRLRVVSEDPEANPIDIIACVLSDSDGVRLCATAGGFWSDGLSLTEFSERLGSAVEAERQVYRAYRAGRVKEADWQGKFRMFWKVMIRCREIQRLATTAVLPRVGSMRSLGEGAIRATTWT